MSRTRCKCSRTCYRPAGPGGGSSAPGLPACSAGKTGSMPQTPGSCLPCGHSRPRPRRMGPAALLEPDGPGHPVGNNKHIFKLPRYRRDEERTPRPATKIMSLFSRAEATPTPILLPSSLCSRRATISPMNDVCRLRQSQHRSPLLVFRSSSIVPVARRDSNIPECSDAA